MSPANLDAFAERLKRLLVQHGMTQTELATRTGIDRVDLNRMANGKREPKPGELAWLSKVFGVKPEELLEGVDTAEVNMYSTWAGRVLDAEAEAKELRAQLEARDGAHQAAEARWLAEREELVATWEQARKDCNDRVAKLLNEAAEREAAMDREARALKDQVALRDEELRAATMKLVQQTREIENLRAELAKQGGRQMFAGLVGAAVGALLTKPDK